MALKHIASLDITSVDLMGHLLSKIRTGVALQQLIPDPILLGVSPQRPALFAYNPNIKNTQVQIAERLSYH